MIMITVLGKKGTTFSHQRDFPERMKCECGGTGEVAFVAYEGTREESLVCELFDTKPDDGTLWVHDAVAVAVYICRKCLKPTSTLNQG